MFSFLEGLLLAVLGIGKNAQSAQHKTPAVGLLTYGADAVAQPRGGAIDPSETKEAAAKHKAEIKNQKFGAAQKTVLKTDAAHKGGVKMDAASVKGKAAAQKSLKYNKATGYKELK